MATLKLTNPSGRTAATSYDLAGRPVGVTSGAANATVNAYHPHGALKTLTLGNGLVETALYNNRQQMTSLTAIKDAVPRLTLGYGYPTGQNNGNLASQSIADTTGSWQQTYTYDSFNRLTHAAEAGSWSETSSYDRWGNRWVSASSFPLNLATPTAATQFDTATNRLQQESNGQPLPPNAYDAQGNLTNHPWIGQMSYDGEGKIWRHIKGGTTVEFTYDGEGRRVKKRVGTAPPTIYTFNPVSGTSEKCIDC